MIFMDRIWFFTIYPKMYKLFKIFLALERDKELIKPWKCDQLWHFRGEGNRTNYDVSYETGISMKTLEFLSFKFIVLMLSLISHEICKLDGSIYSTFLHWTSRLYRLDVKRGNCLLGICIYLTVVWIEGLWPHIISAKLFYSAVIQGDCHTVCKVNHSVYKLLIIVQTHRSVCLFHTSLHKTSHPEMLPPGYSFFEGEPTSLFFQ